MSEYNVISLENLDVLTGLLRSGARELITFSTIRLRAKKTRACVSRTTILTMVYKLGLSAEKGWRKLRGFRRLADVINGIKFIDGIDEETIKRQRNAA